MKEGGEKRPYLEYVRVFFAANGFGPYTCVHCKLDVAMNDVEVHHLDGDHDNNDPANLSATHHACHTVIHHKGRQKSSEEIERLRAAAIQQHQRRRESCLQV